MLFGMRRITSRSESAIRYAFQKPRVHNNLIHPAIKLCEVVYKGIDLCLIKPSSGRCGLQKYPEHLTLDWLSDLAVQFASAGVYICLRFREHTAIVITCHNVITMPTRYVQ